MPTLKSVGRKRSASRLSGPLSAIGSPDSVPCGVYSLHHLGVAACVRVVLHGCVFVGSAGSFKLRAVLRADGLEVLFDGRRASSREWITLLTVAAVAAPVVASVTAAVVARATAAARAARPTVACVASRVPAALAVFGFGAALLASLEECA